MKKEYKIGVDQGFKEDRTITVLIFKSQDVIDESGDLTPGTITGVEVFESAFSSKAEITKFKKILSDDLEIDFKDIEFNLIPRGDMTPEKDRD